MTNTAVVVVTRRPEMWPNVVENVLRQSVRPSLCVLVTHGTLPIPEVFVDAMEDNLIEFICDGIPEVVSPGELMNHAFNRAAAWLGDGALLCTMDDDDYYGEDYLATMLGAYEAHPDAWVLGKSTYHVRYVGGRKDGQVLVSEGRIIDAEGHARSLAGSTFCVPSAIWNAYPTLRYRDMGMGCDGEFLQQASALGGSIYHVEAGGFFLQRYADISHKHTWRDPRDAE